MEHRRRLHNGSKLIAERTKVAKELPLLGLKEFSPTNSWLEGKKIEKCLEERFDILSEERIEKISSLTKADWVPELNKAKVTQKLGKIWETFGHHVDNQDWLLPEEALYLLETNALELFYGEVQMSIERGYTLLLQDANGCSLNQYRTYSYLCRNGYKLVRHSREVKFKCYGQKTDEVIEIGLVEDEDENSNKDSETKKSVSEGSEIEIVVLDEDKEPIIVDSEDVVMKEDGNLPLKEYKQENEITNAKVISQIKEGDKDVILIDDDECVVSLKEESGRSYPPREDSSDSEDVVYILSMPGKSKDINSWCTFASISNFLAEENSMSPSSAPSDNKGVNEVIDLCDEDEDKENTENKDIKRGMFLSQLKKDLRNKSITEILSSLPSAKNGLSYLRCPDLRLVPSNIIPKYSEYRVNLNIRSQPRLQYRPRYFYRRPYSYNSLDSRYQHHPQNFDHNSHSIIRQAQEMQAMAVGMMQVASTLMSSLNQPTHNSPSLLGSPVLQPSLMLQQVSTIARQFQTPTYSNMTPNYHSFTSPINSDRSSGMLDYNRRSSENRNPIWRPENNYCPRTSAYNQHYKIQSPSFNENRSSNNFQNRSNRKPEVVVIDSDEENDGVEIYDDVQAVKRENDTTEETCRKRLKLDSNNESWTEVGNVISCKEEKEHVDQESSNNINENHIKKENSGSPVLNNSNTTDNIDKETFVKVEVECPQIEEIKTEKSGQILEITKEPIKTELEINSRDVSKEGDNVNHQVKSLTERIVNVENSSEENLLNKEFSKVAEEKNDAQLEKVRTWEEYKRQHDSESGPSGEKTIFDDVSPLVKPDDTTTPGDVFSCLQIFQKFDTPQEYGLTKLKISFDVYLPNVHFKKSLQIRPNYRIIVLGLDDEIPSPAQLLELSHDYQDGVPVLLAVVLEESLAFYLLSTLELPPHT